jgi:hypothetical protein
MAETKNEKKQLNYVANPEAAARIPSAKRLVTNIRGIGDDRYEVYFVVPETDAECQDRYGCPLSELIALGVRNISTRPDYQSFVDKEAGTVDHAGMQKAADEYKPGQRQPGAGAAVKAKAAEAKAAEEELGMSLAEMIALVKAKKAAKK